MTIHVALAGKGSSGKSTVAALWLADFCAAKTGKRLLMVDADPNSTLSDLLGHADATSLGQLRSRYEREFKTGAGLAPDETREEFAEREMGVQAVVRAAGYDFLRIGHWELPGSNCVTNRVMERALSTLAVHYDILMVDNEAGFEHVGRFRNFPVDVLALFALGEPAFLRVLDAVSTRLAEVSRPVQERWLIANRLQPGESLDFFEAYAARTGVFERVVGLPEASELRAINRAGRPLTDLPGNHPLWQAISASNPLTR